MITRAITSAIQMARTREWDTLYWGIDLHGTVIVPNWNEEKIPRDCYPLALETLRRIQNSTIMDKNILILSTSSHPKEIEQYEKFFKRNGIEFKYTNSNPEVSSAKGNFGFYDDKYYFNVMIEDKAGFDPYEDWAAIITLLNELERDNGIS
jgi:hypothetical protein